MIKPDIIAEIHFYKTNDGGRKSPIASNYFGCLFKINDEKFDCRLLLDEIGSISPGEIKSAVPIKFLNSQLILPELEIGSKFFLWDMRNIAEGVVRKILAN